MKRLSNTFRPSGENVIDVSCGSGDAQTVAVTDTGKVYSWGDGDFGKLGRGGSDGSKIPKIIDKLEVRYLFLIIHSSNLNGLIQNQDVIRVYCGCQFTLALTREGRLFSWGKGDNQRLGHNSEEHVRIPKLIKGLEGVRVAKVAIGSMHSVILTDKNEMYVWGRNDQAQLGDSPSAAIAEPTHVSTLIGKTIIGIACGPSQVS